MLCHGQLDVNTHFQLGQVYRKLQSEQLLKNPSCKVSPGLITKEQLYLSENSFNLVNYTQACNFSVRFQSPHAKENFQISQFHLPKHCQ